MQTVTLTNEEWLGNLLAKTVLSINSNLSMCEKFPKSPRIIDINYLNMTFSAISTKAEKIIQYRVSALSPSFFAFLMLFFNLWNCLKRFQQTFKSTLKINLQPMMPKANAALHLNLLFIFLAETLVVMCPQQCVKSQCAQQKEKKCLQL